MASRLTLVLGWFSVSICLLTPAHSVTVEVDGLSVQRMNSTAFNGGGDFTRLCVYTGSGVLSRLEWLGNSELYSTPGDLSRGTNSLFLSISNITYSHQGEYSCRAVLSDGNIAGPVSAGFLQVLDPSLIVAPPVQYVLLSSTTSLQCTSSYPDSVVLWDKESTITNAQVSDEQVYTCRVVIGGSVTAERPVQVVVVVPPRILYSNATDVAVSGNVPLTLTATFQSRTQALTNITWEKVDGSISETRTQIQTVWNSDDSLNGTTSLSFSSITRADQGVYRINIHNAHDIIPDNQGTVSRTLRITSVIVPPAQPSSLSASTINSTHTGISWTLTHQTEDERATSLLLNVISPLPSNLQIPPSQETVIIKTLPGTVYTVSLTATNQDGQVTTPHLSFTTNPLAPQISSIEAQRLNDTAINLTVHLQYTGGGEITELSISFHSSETTGLISLPTVVPMQLGSSNNVWNSVLVSNLFAEHTGLRFSVDVTNGQSLTANGFAMEEIIPPGAPQIPNVISITVDSLAIQVQLSDVGTEPIHEVYLAVTCPEQRTSYWNITGRFVHGEIVQFEVTNLKSSTVYTIVAYGVNAGGQGTSSDAATANTPGTSLPISMEALIGIAVVGSVFITMFLVLSIVCIFYCYKCYKKNSGERYCTADYKDKPREMESSAEHVNKNYQYNGNGYPPFLARSEGTYTPRSPTLTSRASSCLPPSKFDGGTEYSYDGSDQEGFSQLHRRQPDSVDGFHDHSHFQYRHSPAPLTIPEHVFFSSLSMISPDPELNSPPATALSFATDV